MGDETEVYCDASRVGLSYVLVQVRNGERVIITCGSVALTEAQKNYSVTELEALAIQRQIAMSHVPDVGRPKYPRTPNWLR